MKKINIAELLKDCPEGTKLYSPLCGECYFDRLNIGTIICKKQNTQEITFTSKGYYMLPVFDDCECLLFPSKENRDWSKFQRPFKDGDIVAFDTEKGAQLFIFKEYIQDHWYIKSAKCYMMLDCGGEIDFESDSYYVERLATEDEKEKLFDAIKTNGYKWNAETKTLEKLVESNEDVDDRIVMSGIYFDREHYADEVELHLGNYEIEIRNGKTYAIFKNQKTETLKPKFKVGDRIIKRDSIVNSWIVSSVSSEYYGLQLPNRSDGIGVLPIVEQDDYELVSDIEPKFKKGDKIKHKVNTEWVCTIRRVEDRYYVDGHPTSYTILFDKQDEYELVPNKFDINTLKPFDKVLVRVDNSYWRTQFFEKINKKNKNYAFGCMNGNNYKQCIPYEGNEHLLSKTNDCDEYYKNWE